MIDKGETDIAKFLYEKLMEAGFGGLEFRERKMRIEYICANVDQRVLYNKPVTQNRKELLINRILT